MASDYGVLGQSNPSATTLTDVYEVPTGKRAIVSSLILCNRSATPTTYRLSVAPGGAANDAEHYLAYDAPLAANEVWGWTVGLTLGEGDIVRVYVDDATVSLSIFGEELDAA